MEKINVEVFNTSDNPLPKYATEFASGMDLIAYIPEEEEGRKLMISGGETKLVKTGLFVAIPEGYEIQVRPRSGLALKLGITVLNSPGTIDSDYRGEVGVILHNTRATPFFVYNGDRIAQAVIAPTHRIMFNQVSKFEDLSVTARSTGGFGSTGVNSK